MITCQIYKSQCDHCTRFVSRQNIGQVYREIIELISVYLCMLKTTALDFVSGFLENRIKVLIDKFESASYCICFAFGYV